MSNEVNVESKPENFKELDQKVHPTGVEGEVPQAESFDAHTGEKIEWLDQVLKDAQEDWIVQTVIAVLLVAQLFTQTLYSFTMQSSFILATYAVIANDSIQTIGTFIAATKHVPFYFIWLLFTFLYVATTLYGYFNHDQDIGFGRLATKGFAADPTSYTYYEAAAPVLLTLITRLRMPVSTSLLLVGVMTDDSKDFLEVVQWSAYSQLIAFGVALVAQPILQHGFVKRLLQGDDQNVITRVVEVICTSWLFVNWIMLENAVFAIQLRRTQTQGELVMIIVAVSAMLFYIAWNRGEKVQTVVDQKQNTKNMNEVSLIDLGQGAVLFQFKTTIDLPMGTTWTFLGFLAGRELGITLTDYSHERLLRALYLVFKDALMAIIGFAITCGIIMLENPNYFS